MGLPYLKLEPIQAIQILDECIVNGYRIKDKVTNEYYNDKTKVEEKIITWGKMVTDWANDTFNKLGNIFVSQKELYNFRDSPASPMMQLGTNMKWNSIINQLQARIDKLNEYDKHIRNAFEVKVEFVAGDKIVQHGDNNQVEIAN